MNHGLLRKDHVVSLQRQALACDLSRGCHVRRGRRETGVAISGEEFVAIPSEELVAISGEEFVKILGQRLFRVRRLAVGEELLVLG